jgi:hypothetical protein
MRVSKPKSYFIARARAQMDKMYTGPQGCYKQVGKMKKALDITIHEDE